MISRLSNKRLTTIISHPILLLVLALVLVFTSAVVKISAIEWQFGCITAGSNCNRTYDCDRIGTSLTCRSWASGCQGGYGAMCYDSTSVPSCQPDWNGSVADNPSMACDGRAIGASCGAGRACRSDDSGSWSWFQNCWCVTHCMLYRPDKPILESPANNAIVPNAELALTWSRVTNWGAICSGAEYRHYRLFFKQKTASTCGTTGYTQITEVPHEDGGGFPPAPIKLFYSARINCNPLDTAGCVPISMTNNATYCWYVQAHNGQIASLQSDTYEFRVQASCPYYYDKCGPNTPVPGTPPNTRCTAGCSCENDPNRQDFETLLTCGNGVTDNFCGEQCDDANAVAGDGCNNCILEYCGDQVVNGTEQCDLGDGGTPAPNNSDLPNATCRTNCQDRRCGDMIVDNSFNEECDDGNLNNFDTCNNTCRFTATANAWMATTEGNTYAQNGYGNFSVETVSSLNPPVDAASYGYDYNKPVRLAEYLVGASNANLPLGNNISENNYQALNYANLAVTQYSRVGKASWYEYYRAILVRNSTIAALSSNTIDSPSMAGALGRAANSLAIMERTGDLIIQNTAAPYTINCDLKAIILVTGNLTIIPDMRASGVTNGCIFIVAGTITVDKGQRKNPPTAIGSDPTQYDIVEAMLVSSSTVTVPVDTFGGGEKGDGLLIKGGVVAEAIAFGRNLTGYSNTRQPSEIVIFDPRYQGITEFRNVLDLKQFAVREF